MSGDLLRSRLVGENGQTDILRTGGSGMPFCAISGAHNWAISGFDPRLLDGQQAGRSWAR